jgi:biotin carboxylase
VTGFDLVRAQILIAAGVPNSLPAEVSFRGHAIEARICAEDPERNFAPVTGRVTNLDLPGWARRAGGRQPVRGHGGLGVLRPHAREAHRARRRSRRAIARLRRALLELRITGVQTNTSFLLGISETADFARGIYDTGFIEHTGTRS